MPVRCRPQRDQKVSNVLRLYGLVGNGLSEPKQLSGRVSHREPLFLHAAHASGIKWTAPFSGTSPLLSLELSSP